MVHVLVGAMMLNNSTFSNKSFIDDMIEVQKITYHVEMLETAIVIFEFVTY